MKNTKKIVSLILAICMIASLAISASAANTVDASGGTGTSSVTLSSTADGSIGGDPAATKMSVTVPTVLPIAVGTDGTVSTATDAKIRKAFREEIPGTTKIIIAQRISSVQDADRILVLENGQINGLGTHAELLATNAIYQEVYNSQTQGGGDFDKQGGAQ